MIIRSSFIVPLAVLGEARNVYVLVKKKGIKFYKRKRSLKRFDDDEFRTKAQRRIWWIRCKPFVRMSLWICMCCGLAVTLLLKQETPEELEKRRKKKTMRHSMKKKWNQADFSCYDKHQAMACASVHKLRWDAQWASGSSNESEEEKSKWKGTKLLETNNISEVTRNLLETETIRRFNCGARVESDFTNLCFH